MWMSWKITPGFFLIFASTVFAGRPYFVRFELYHDPITLERAVEPWNYFTVVGRKSFLVGRETGVVEAWIPPFKILHDLRCEVVRTGREYNLDLASLARYIWVRPAATTIRYVHSSFTIDATYFAPIESPGLVILLDVHTSEAITLLVQFQPDLQPMWPGGLGGQFSYWSEEEKGFILSESRWKYVGIIGSPFASRGSVTPAHAQPKAPIQFTIQVNPDSLENSLIPIVIVGSVAGMQKAKSIYQDLRTHLAERYHETVAHFQQIREQFLSVKLPDRNLSLAIEWAKVMLDKGLIDNPQLGRALVAGFGPSGRSARPGFAWYFGGDAAINSWAINDYGGSEIVKESLQFYMKFQRQDGKIPHEISQSAAMLPWFEEYPYPYYHAETTPLFLIAMADYYNHTGDVAFIQKSWPAVKKAFAYCLSADSNQDGLMDNIKAGLGAVELGELRKAETEVDIYLATLWAKALQAMTVLAGAKEDFELVEECNQRFKKAKKNLNTRFWRPTKQMFSFALLTDGSSIDDSTTWQAVPVCFGLTSRERAEITMRRFEQPDMSTDWGVRFLSKASPKYQFWGYNTGAVWPFTTMFAIWGGFKAHRFRFAKNLWQNLAELTFSQQLGAISELFSGDRFQAIETAVPHQLFSSSPVIVGFTRGLLGLEIDVPHKTMHLAPHWPRNWTEVEIRNLPFGSNKLSFTHHHNPAEIRLDWEKDHDFPVTIALTYYLLPGEAVKEMTLQGHGLPFSRKKSRTISYVQTTFTLQSGKTELVLKGSFHVDSPQERGVLYPGAQKRSKRRTSRKSGTPMG